MKLLPLRPFFFKYNNIGHQVIKALFDLVMILILFLGREISFNLSLGIEFRLQVIAAPGICRKKMFLDKIRMGAKQLNEQAFYYKRFAEAVIVKPDTMLTKLIGMNG